MVSPLLNAMRNKIVEKVCNEKVAAIQKTISDIVADPIKLNDYQNFAYLIYKATFDTGDLSVNQMNFAELKPLYGALEGEFGTVFKDCSTKYNSPEKFFYEVIKSYEDFEGFHCILEKATSDGIGEDRIAFNVNDDNLSVIQLNCPGVDYPFSFDD